MQNLLLSLAYGLRSANAERTRRTLGDRSEYIGMSDIGKAANCLRAAVLGKIRDEDRKRNHTRIAPDTLPSTLSRELRCQRGHWFEAGIAEAFHLSGKPHFRQLTITTNYSGVPIQAHPDFVFLHRAAPPQIQVVECKSTATIPETVHGAHEMQLFGQIGMLHALWNTPSFSVANTPGQCVTFPELVLREKAISFPAANKGVVIEGYILTVSMDEVKLTGPYTPNVIMAEMAFFLAGLIWASVAEIRSGAKSAADLSIAKGFHPLCDWCEFNTDCPRFEGVTAPQMELELERLDFLKQEKNLAANRVKQAEAICKTLFTAISPNGDWVSAQTRRFRVATCDGKRTLDADRLREELIRRLGDKEAEAVLARAYSTGAPFERLLISPINKQ